MEDKTSKKEYLRTKNLDELNNLKNQFSNSLNLLQLTGLGIGAIIGAGIFIYTGEVASNYSGPAVTLSFLISGLVALFSALSCCELASLIPLTGSTYTYVYYSMGELIAWIIGWDLILEGVIGTASIAVGWSGYISSLFLHLFGFNLPNTISKPLLIWSSNSLSISPSINFGAIFIILILSLLLILGTKEMAKLNMVIVGIKIMVIITFILASIRFLKSENWTPFIPESKMFGEYGITGILKGSSILFFSYLGFDSIAIASQESKNPQRDVPIAITTSLLLSSLIYMTIAFVLVGLVPYKELNVANPISLAIEKTGFNWLVVFIDIGIISGLTSVIMMSLMALSRIMYAMSIDGLIPTIFCRLHPKFKTPYINNIITMILCSFIAGVFPINILSQLTTIGSLLSLIFMNLSVIVLRIKRKDLERKFQVPFGPYVIPVLGALSAFILILFSSYIAFVRLFCWFFIGLIIYFNYGKYHSQLNNS